MNAARRLTADAAHELATPVASIQSGAEVALRRARSQIEYQDALRLVVEEAQHLERIVDDLLLLARADAGHLVVANELVEIDDVCRQTVRAMTPLAGTRMVGLEVEVAPEPILVHGDELRLGQVVRDLIDNALTHTPPGGTVWVTASSATDGKSEPRVTVSVRDTGPGIPLAEQDHVFERFHRVDGGESKHVGTGHRRSGTGLGLAICKAIVTAHGGQIYVADTGEPAANFVVELPALTVAKAALDGVASPL